MIVSVYLKNGDTINHFEVKKTKEKKHKLIVKDAAGISIYEKNDMKSYLISK